MGKREPQAEDYTSICETEDSAGRASGIGGLDGCASANAQN